MDNPHSTPDSTLDASGGSAQSRGKPSRRRINGSRPGEINFLIPISNGLLAPEHRKRMGIAVWEFAWLVDRTTQEVDGCGVVLGGRPISYGEIAKSLGISDRTVQTNCHALRDAGYIGTVPTSRGVKFVVAKSKKFAASRAEGTFPSDRKKPSDLVGRNLPLHIDNALDSTLDVSSSSEAKSPSDQARVLAGLLRSEILKNNPKAKAGSTERALRNWAVEADRMMGQDGRTEAEIRELIEWSQGDSFWKSIILSMANLREKFDQLTLKAGGGGKHGDGSGQRFGKPSGAVHGDTAKYSHRKPDIIVEV